MIGIPNIKFRHRRWLAESINGTVLLAVGLPSLLMHLTGDVLVRNGFYCNDESLGYPYMENTVPTSCLMAVCVTVPLTVMAIVEGSHPADRPLRAKLFSFYRMTMSYFFGFLTTFLFTDIGKYTVGRLRPNFFAMCKPDFDKINCGNGSHPFYVTDYECTDFGGFWWMKKNSRLSFPSGHASYSCQAAAFVIFYIQAKVAPLSNEIPCNLLVPFVQLTAATLAFFVSLTRITDYWHFPTDVYAGAIIGTAVQYANCAFVIGLFDKGDSYEVETAGSSRPYAESRASSVTDDGKSHNYRVSPTTRDDFVSKAS